MAAACTLVYTPPIHGISEFDLSRCDHQPPGFPDTPAGELLGHAAEFFRAMGDVERLRLLSMFQDGERCVGELVGTHEKLSTVSARLQALHRARLLHRRREARHIYYRLADEHVAHLLNNALEHAAERLAPTQPPTPEDDSR